MKVFPNNSSPMQNVPSYIYNLRIVMRKCLCFVKKNLYVLVFIQRNFIKMLVYLFTFSKPVLRDDIFMRLDYRVLDFSYYYFGESFNCFVRFNDNLICFILYFLFYLQDDMKVLRNKTN